MPVLKLILTRGVLLSCLLLVSCNELSHVPLQRIDVQNEMVVYYYPNCPKEYLKLADIADITYERYHDVVDRYKIIIHTTVQFRYSSNLYFRYNLEDSMTVRSDYWRLKSALDDWRSLHD